MNKSEIVIISLKRYSIFSFLSSATLNVFNVSQCARASDTALVCAGREGVNPRHVVRKFFLLKLVT
jgi:hypothetical protein